MANNFSFSWYSLITNNQQGRSETAALIDPSVIRTEREIKRFSEIVNINASKNGNKQTQTQDGHN